MDTGEIKKVAKAAGEMAYDPPQPYEEDRSYSDAEIAWLEFVNQASPVVVSELIAENEQLKAELECARGDSNTADIIIEKLKSEQADLIRAIEIVLLHVKPSKANAVALNHAHQAISKFNQDQAKERT